MQRITLVRYTVKPEHLAENEALSRAVFDELQQTAPGHLAYAVFRDGAAFTHLFVNRRDASAEALTELASFKTYGKDIAGRCVAPPEVTRVEADLVEAYGFQDIPPA